MPQVRQNWWRIAWRLKVYSVSASAPRSSVKLAAGVKARHRAEALAARAVAGDGLGDVDGRLEGDGAALARAGVAFCGHSSSPMTCAVEAEDAAGAGVGDEADVAGLPGLEAHGGAGGDVEAAAAGGGAVEGERGVGLGEVVVRADLDRAVAGVGDDERDRLAAGVEGDLARGGEDLAGDHRASPGQAVGARHGGSWVGFGRGRASADFRGQVLSADVRAGKLRRRRRPGTGRKADDRASAAGDDRRLQRGVEPPRRGRHRRRCTPTTWCSRTTPAAARRWGARRSREVVAGVFATFPDIRFELRRLYLRDELIVQEWTATATHAKPVRYKDAVLEPSGRTDAMGRDGHHPGPGRQGRAEGRLRQLARLSAGARRAGLRRGEERRPRGARGPRSAGAWRSAAVAASLRRKRASPAGEEILPACWRGP